ncbi:hypothetical protein WJX74_009526 [Apatococcus lobatus]|uniref:Transcription factor CBF/NF-Y/archaeal histone domain-containing protein n=1 Tax=Apatococcus lobatus TaxID=904363 RepID=A0AAW1QKG6_9CHLO
MEGQQVPQQAGHEGYYDDPYQAHQLAGPSAAIPAADLQADEVFEAADAGPDLGQRDQDDLILPIGRVKRIIKMESDVKAVSAEASYAVARATELLLDELVARSATGMLQEGRKTLLYKDVAGAVGSWKALSFLQDIVPEKVPAAVLIEQLQQQQRQQLQQQQQQAGANGFSEHEDGLEGD